MKKNKPERKVFDIREHVTIDGRPVFDSVTVDPETGDLLDYEITSELQEQIEAKTAAATQMLTDMANGAGPDAEAAREAYREAVKMSAKVREAVQSVFNADTRQVLHDLIDKLQPIQDALNELEVLQPYIEEELKKPEYGGVTLEELLNEITPAQLLELPQDSILFKAMEAARSARASALLVIDTHKTDVLNTPVDRVNFLAWNNFKETGDQIAFNLMSITDKRNPERCDMDITMQYSLTFDSDPNIKTTKELNHYDRRLMQAADTLFTNDTSGQHIFLTGDIFRAMGGKGVISANQRKKLNESLTKQGTARIYMNNKAEAKHYKYPHIEYDGNVLNFERIRVKYNGQEVEAIHFLRRPVFMELSDGRGQVTVIPIKVLQSSVSQTDDNLRIEDYLLHRIVRAKNELRALLDQQQKKYTQDRQRKIKEAAKLTILLNTFYDEIGRGKSKKDLKQRAVKTAERYLKHYISEEGGHYISSYKVEEDRIIISLPAEYN